MIREGSGTKSDPWTTTLFSFDELIQLSASKPRHEYERSSREATASQDWDFGVGYEKALEMVSTGWPEGSEKIRQALDLIVETLKPRGPELKTSYEVSGGAFVDVARFLAQEPECFVSFVPADRTTQPIDVMIHCGALCYVTGDQMFNRGAAIAAAVDVLEARGYTCNITLVEANSGSNRVDTWHNTYIPLKHAGQPLDLDRIGFTLAHPAFFRRIVFGALEQEPKEVVDAIGYHSGRGYGRTGEIDHSAYQLYFGEPSKITDKLGSVKDAAKWVAGCLKDSKLLKEDEINV